MAAKKQPQSKKCPNCGACQECGHAPVKYVPYPVYPPYPYYPSTYPGYQRVWYTTSGTGSNITWQSNSGGQIQ